MHLTVIPVKSSLVLGVNISGLSPMKVLKFLTIDSDLLSLVDKFSHTFTVLFSPLCLLLQLSLLPTLELACFANQCLARMPNVHCDQRKKHGHSIEDIGVDFMGTEFTCQAGSSAGRKLNNAEKDTELDQGLVQNITCGLNELTDINASERYKANNNFLASSTAS